jgi:hypothetical protein
MMISLPKDTCMYVDVIILFEMCQFPIPFRFPLSILSIGFFFFII